MIGHPESSGKTALRASSAEATDPWGAAVRVEVEIEPRAPLKMTLVFSGMMILVALRVMTWGCSAYDTCADRAVL